MSKTSKTASQGPKTEKGTAKPSEAGGTIRAANSEIDRLETMNIGELQALFAKVVGKPTKSPNRTFLVRSIVEATVPAGAVSATEATASTASGEPAGKGNALPTASGLDDEQAQAQATEASETTETAAGPELKLTKLSVPELQAKYAEVLGRETRSTSQSYLVWKIRASQRGRVPLGPRESRRKGGESFKVLPLRLEADLVDHMDADWRRHGLASRTDLFRVALRLYFDGVGERALADRLTEKD